MEDVGTLEPADLEVPPDRRAGHYVDALQLARHILQLLGRTLSEGRSTAWTFLIRTPDVVESGIRTVLARSIGPNRVTKEGRQATGSTLTFNPDLVFDRGVAVGDVKYKMAAGEWARADLYQVIAFAEAFRTNVASIVRFRRPTTAPMTDVVVGETWIREVTWLADGDLDPPEAATMLGRDISDWLVTSAPARSA